MVQQKVTAEEEQEFVKTFEAMKARIGEETRRRVSFPVDKSLIRIWAIANRWPESPDRLYWDEEYARKSRWGGIIAPPNFNPFAYHIDEDRMAGSARNMGDVGIGRGNRSMNAGGEAEYFAPILPGGVITAVSKIADVYRRDTATMGPTFFMVTETTWTNQKGELVKIYRGGSIRY